MLRLLDDEVVERLADHAEEGEQRERRAHHHALAQGVVDQRRVVLVDEAGELLVGEEQHDVVDRATFALVVVAPGEVLDLRPHVAQERLEVLAALGVGRRRQVAEVGGERELDVHVQDVTLGQVEREVRAARTVASGAAQLRLLAVVDVLDEAGEAQHVLGHPLAPLATGLRVGQRLLQRSRGVAQRRGDLGVRAQRGVDLSEALRAGVAEGGDEVAEAVELAAHLAAHGLEVGADDVLAGVEPGLQAHRRAVEVAAVEHVDLLQRRGDGGIALDAMALAELADGDGEGTPRRRRHGQRDPGHGQERHGDDGGDCDHVHAKSMTRGCDNVADARLHPPRSTVSTEVCGAGPHRGPLWKSGLRGQR